MVTCIEKLYKKEFLITIYQIYTQNKIHQAIRYLEQFRGKRIVATVSGKDSLVALDLALRTFGPIEAIVNKYVGRRQLPDEVVHELAQIAKKMGANVTITEYQWNAHSTLFNQIARDIEIDIIITGLRRQEDDWVSDIYRFNNRSVLVVSPVHNWRHSDIWSYIYVHGIPIPTPYCNAVVPWASLQSLLI